MLFSINQRTKFEMPSFTDSKDAKCSLSNAYTQRILITWLNIARGSHSFNWHRHVYPRMEWAILHMIDIIRYDWD